MGRTVSWFRSAMWRVSADRIAELAGDAEKVIRMGQAARRTIEESSFTLDAMAEAYIALMEKVVSQPFSRPKMGMLPPDKLRGWHSWLPREWPDLMLEIETLRKRVRLGDRVKRAVQRAREVTADECHCW